MNNKIFNYAQLDDQIKAEKATEFAYKSLMNEWNFPEELIRRVANHFQCASEGNIFLDALDATSGLEEAWDRYCVTRDITHEDFENPFID